MYASTTEYLNQKITEFRKSIPSSADWNDLKNTVKDLLGFQSNSYFEAMYPCKAMLSYYIWYKGPIYEEEQFISGSVNITQPIAVLSNLDSSLHQHHYWLNLPHKCLNQDFIPKYLMIAFLYPECGKVIMCKLRSHITINNNDHLLRIKILNWNWFIRDNTYAKIDDHLMSIDLTLSTGASAMPLGICNVVIPRFENASQNLEYDIDILSDAYYYKYPSDVVLNAIIDVVNKRRFSQTDQLPWETLSTPWGTIIPWGSVSACSWHVLIGNIIVKVDQGKILADSVLVNKLIDIAKNNMSNVNDSKFSSNDIFNCMCKTPNFFALNKLVVVELCLIECKCPKDIFTAILGVIGEMMW